MKDSLEFTWYKSLVFKISVCSTVLIFCLVASIFGAASHYHRVVVEEMWQKINIVVDELSVRVGDVPIDSISRDDLGLMLDEIRSEAGVDVIVVQDGAGRELSRVEEPEFQEIEIGFSPEVDSVEPVRDSSKVNMYRITRLMQAGDQVVGVTAVVGLTRQAHLERVFRNRLLWVLLGLFLLAVGAMCYFVIKLLRPLRDLSAACAEIGAGNLKPVGVKPNSNEILVLERKFNQMVEALREKEKIERQLAQSQKLSALGNLAAGVAHDIRNPLNSIKLITSHLKDLIAATSKGDDRNRLEKYTQTIMDEVGRLDQIVSGFLTLAKERKLDMTECSMDEIVAEVIQLAANEAGQRGITISTDLKLAGTVQRLDRAQMKRALLNVVLNAMDAIEKGGRLSITSRPDGDGVAVLVRDNGAGISSELLSRVFEPYFSTKRSGTGLGLSITKNIVEQHGGTASIESTPGVGTCVTIHMPLADAAGTQAKSAREATVEAPGN
jgi:signal transduction histidine kinase